MCCVLGHCLWTCKRKHCTVFTELFPRFCCWTLIWLSRHWAWLRRGYWRNRSLIDWLIDQLSLSVWYLMEYRYIPAIIKQIKITDSHRCTVSYEERCLNCQELWMYTPKKLALGSKFPSVQCPARYTPETQTRIWHHQCALEDEY